MNRHQRRAAIKVVKQSDDGLEPIPNVSGTDEACGSCRFSPSVEIYNQIQKLHRKPVPPEDEVNCLRFPGGGCMMKVWGWCGEWKPRLNA